MKRFKEKTVIVTGAGSAIGRATAIRFANEGANVILVGRSADVLKEITKEFPQDRTWIHTDNFLTIACDIGVESQVQEMIKRVINKFERIDVLVNNAPQMPDENSGLSIEQSSSAVDDYLNEILYVSQTAMPYLIQSKGNIVNVPSFAACNSDQSVATYHDSTAGITDLTRTLASNHSTDGVRINAVNPNVTEADISAAIQTNGMSNDDINNVQTNNTASSDSSPLGRCAMPNDIAAAITFLASDDAAMITGTNLPVDGGVSTSNR